KTGPLMEEGKILARALTASIAIVTGCRLSTSAIPRNTKTKPVAPMKSQRLIDKPGSSHVAARGKRSISASRHAGGAGLFRTVPRRGALVPTAPSKHFRVADDHSEAGQMFFQVLGQGFRHAHRAVLATRAADGDGQPRLAFRPVVGQHLGHQHGPFL